MNGVFNPTIAGITARALVGRRRFLLLLPLPVLMVGLAMISKALGAYTADWAPAVINELGFAVVLPVMALIVGAGVLGSEIDDGTLAHILAKPVSRTSIVISKLVVAIAVLMVTVALPLYAVGIVAGSVRLGLGLIAGAALGALAYGTLFIALSLVTRRPVLLGLLYVLIWEGILTSVLTGARVVSIRQYAIAVADRVSQTDLFSGSVSLPVALGMTFVIAVGATVLAIDRLRSFSVVGETS